MPAFYVFLQIDNWATFLFSAITAFTVELIGVYWVTVGERAMQHARDQFLPVNRANHGAQEEKEKEQNLFEIDVYVVLGIKLAHQQLCEKISLVGFFVVVGRASYL